MEAYFLSNMAKELDALCVNTIRFLSIDQVEAAKSGHPGAPMGMAAFAYSLWDRVMKFNPSDPEWINRDRFVLSAGHASALLYSLLHLFGYGLTLDELKRFRQWESRTPGHPERNLENGIETTTGPLGQGFSNAVGMAIAENWQSSNYNKPGFKIIDHYTYAIVSDGDLQEGVSSEAASFAGTLGLEKLIVLYDDNKISIEGNTDITFDEDVKSRFRSYGWNVIGPIDGLDVDSVEESLKLAKDQNDKPTIIICNTQIGYGSPGKQGMASAHGEPLGSEERDLTRENLDWPYTEPFHIPEEAKIHFDLMREKGSTQQKEWEELYDSYKSNFPDEAKVLEDGLNGRLPNDFSKRLFESVNFDDKPMATRVASGKVMNAISTMVPFLIGGSADLGPSTKTLLDNKEDLTVTQPGGNNMHFGVREHAMGAIANGISVHGGLMSYTATFLAFYDYMRPSIRLAALMGLNTIYIFTHDSIGLGEDGPTHQPIEHLVGMRAVPNLTVIRPADAHETFQAWEYAINNNVGPTSLILSRQNLPIITSDHEKVSYGAYVLYQFNDEEIPEIILIATGSEVKIALEVANILSRKNINSRVVSMPSWEIFEKQESSYKESVLPSAVRNRVSIEASATIGWDRYIGLDGLSIGIDRFGASAPAQRIFSEYGFDPEKISIKITSLFQLS